MIQAVLKNGLGWWRILNIINKYKDEDVHYED